MGVSAWRAVEVKEPPNNVHGTDVWIEKAQQALGFEEESEPFEYEVLLANTWMELKWCWYDAADGYRSVARVLLDSADYYSVINEFLDTACALSKMNDTLIKEGREASELISHNMESFRLEVEKSTDEKRKLYTRCAALINEQTIEINGKIKIIEEKNKELVEKDRIIEQLRRKLGDCDVYDEDTA